MTLRRPRPQPGRQGPLRIDPAPRHRRASAPAATRAAPAGRRVAGHEPDLVARLGEAALDELDRLDHDAGVDCLRARAIRQDPRPDRGWTIASRSRRAAGSANTIRPSAARSSVPSVGAPSASPNRATDRLRLAGPGRGHLAGHRVGVDDDSALAPSQRGDRRLAAADRAGDPDPDRTAAPSGGARRPLLELEPGVLGRGQRRSTSASSLVTRRISTKFAATDGSPIASSRWLLRSPRRVSSASSAFWRR